MYWGSDGLAGAHDEHRNGNHDRQVDEKRKLERPRGVLAEQPRYERTERDADEVCQNRRHGCTRSLLRRIQFGEPGRARPRGDADSEPADDARCKQPRHIACEQKQECAQRGETKCEKAYALPSELVRQPAEEEQPAKISERVRCVNQRQHDFRKAELLAKERVERRDQDAAGKRHGDQSGSRRQRYAAAAVRRRAWFFHRSCRLNTERLVLVAGDSSRAARTLGGR